jgi:hypothetical protein
MRHARLCVLLLATLALAQPAFPQNGNGAPNGAHYNLNIIGVKNPKTPEELPSRRAPQSRVREACLGFS